MNILGFESSCDDTSISLVENGKKIIYNKTFSQIDIHKKYQGVVPEIASRKHLEKIHFLLDDLLKATKLKKENLDYITCTNQPGLIGSLLIGFNTAKALAYAWKKPFIPINHLYGHYYSPSFNNEIEYPVIGLLVSGGNTLLSIINSPIDIKIVGTTIDDACGEAFDKVSKYLGLGYPGGPIIDNLASGITDDKWDFPLSYLKGAENIYNFSYSGIKTSVIRKLEKRINVKNLTKKPKEYLSNVELKELCYSFEKSAIDILYFKTKKLIDASKINRVIISGGVSANSYIRKIFNEDDNIISYFPEKSLCMDNAAMIAGLAFHYANSNINFDFNKTQCFPSSGIELQKL